MKKYKFEPQACYSDQGITYRPFHLEGKEIYRLNIGLMLGDDKAAADKEMVMLCEAIKTHTGAVLSPGELPAAIKNKEIVVSDE